MQDYIKKYFWILGIIAVVICSFLAASNVNHIIAGKYLNDDDEPASIEPSTTTRAKRKPTEKRSKSGEPLAERNMFCSDCEPEEAVVEAVQDPTDPDAVPLTSLPLKLVATNVSTNPKYSFATIQNTDSQSQGAYWISHEIPEAGEVVKIAGKFIDFRNKSSNRLERIALLSSNKAPRSVASKPKDDIRPKKRGKKDEMSAMFDEGIKKVGDNKYEIDRNLVDKVLANPMSVARGARVVPSVKNGKANGFKLYAIRPSSVYAKLGFRNGDTIHAINGFDLTTPDKALEVYTKVKEASNLSVTATRRGKPLSIDYSIR